MRKIILCAVFTCALSGCIQWEATVRPGGKSRVDEIRTIAKGVCEYKLRPLLPASDVKLLGDIATVEYMEMPCNAFSINDTITVQAVKVGAK